jgi:hypothetical protein
MQENVRILLRVLDNVERLKKRRAVAERNRVQARSFLHIRYVAYKAREANETVPWDASLNPAPGGAAG